MKVLINERLSPHKYKTPEGYLICVDAVLARTGKQTYRRSEIFDTDDDSEIDVDRKPEEVFSQSTLASFENKPVTVEHPDEDVNSGNFKDYAVGFVRDVHQGTVEGQDVILGTLVIQDAQTIDEIENGEHTDLSCGYDCDIDDSDNPQQKNIRGNHVALCQCGRAGNARIVDSVKDACYTIGGYVGKYDPVAMTDIKRASKYGVDGSIERTSEGWQLVLRGTPANLKNALENYFGLDASDVEDSIKDEDKNFIVVNKKGKEIYTFKTREEAERMVSSLIKAGEYGYSVKDSMKKDDLNIKPTSKAGSDKAIYVLQSDLDKNLFFYIGKTFAMKDGSYTYQKFEMNGVSPEALRADLLKHGWHDTNENHNMLIDEESTYEEVTKKLEEGADKLQKKMSDSYLSAPAIMRFIRNAESFKEMKTLQFGDAHEGYYVQIQNPGKEEYTLYNGKYKTKGTVSQSWGRVWYDGKFLKAFEGPYNVVRQELIAFLSSQRIQDSMNLIKIAKIAKTISDERLSPMTYKKLKEYGVSSDTWANWTQEQANQYIANKSKKTSKSKTSKSESSSNNKSHKAQNIDKLNSLLQKYKKITGNELKLERDIEGYEFESQSYASVKFKNKSDAKNFAAKMKELGEKVELDTLNNEVSVRTHYDENNKNTKIVRNILNEFKLNSKERLIQPLDKERSSINMKNVDKKDKQRLLNKLNDLKLNAYLNKYGDIIFDRI